MCIFLFFFLKEEDGIRDYKVTGVQTCALPISIGERAAAQQFALADGDDARVEPLCAEPDAELGTDPRRLARGERDDGLIFRQAALRRSSGRAAGAATPGRPRRTCARAAPAAPAAGGAPGSSRPSAARAPG